MTGLNDIPNDPTLIVESLRLSRCVLGPSRARSHPSHLQRQQARLRDLQAQLQHQFLHPIQRVPLGPTAIPLAVRQAFIRAALLVTRYRTVSGAGWQSTMQSFTLDQYEADPIPNELTAPEAIASLCQHFQLPPEDRQQLEQLLQDLDARIDSQGRVIRAVLADVGLVSFDDDASTGERAARLFQYLFGLTIDPGCLHVIHAPLQIYFSLPLERLAEFGSMAASERTKLQVFIDNMNAFNFDSFRRFPTFGPCCPENIDAAWADRIACRAQTTPARVKQILSESVGLLPRSRAEAFLIHDIWGHYWQYLLSSLRGDYAVLATCDEPLRAAETAYTPYGPLRCGDLFKLDGDRVRIDEDRARVFFHGEVRQRLGLLFSHLLGEMMADIAEYKFVRDRPHASDRLLSSSLFKNYPVKLDLTLADLDFLYLRVLKPLLEIHLSPVQKSPLELDLLEQWKSSDNQLATTALSNHLQKVISRLHEIFLEEYHSFYLADIERETSLFYQAAVNLVYLHNVVNQLLADTPSEGDLLPFLNLAIVFMSSFCAEDSFSSFWWLDDVLARYFLPCRQILKQWLESSSNSC
ncbi:MAG: hypothetical protein AAFY57_00410 [Cyanobacteria bacterium J06642_2]